MTPASPPDWPEPRAWLAAAGLIARGGGGLSLQAGGEARRAGSGRPR